MRSKNAATLFVVLSLMGAIFLPSRAESRSDDTLNANTRSLDVAPHLHLALPINSVAPLFSGGDARPVEGCFVGPDNLLKWADDSSWDARGVANQVSLGVEKEIAIQQVTTIFENGTTEFQYASISELGDGKGLNVGRVGFNSKAGSLQLLVDEYLHDKNASSADKAELQKYAGCLKKIKGTGDYGCLYPGVDFGAERKKALLEQGFGKAWKDASADPEMKKLQDQFVEDSFMNPALKMANDASLKSVIARAFIFDAVIQSGENGAAKLIEETKRLFAFHHPGHAFPSGRDEEVEWLKDFNLARERYLSRGKVDTTARVRALTKLLDTGNLDLNPPLQIQYHGVYHVGPR